MENLAKPTLVMVKSKYAGYAGFYYDNLIIILKPKSQFFTELVPSSL